MNRLAAVTVLAAAALAVATPAFASTNWGGVGTGASGGDDPARQGKEATSWVNRSVDTPEAPAQAHAPSHLAVCHPTGNAPSTSVTTTTSPSPSPTSSTPTTARTTSSSSATQRPTTSTAPSKPSAPQSLTSQPSPHRSEPSSTVAPPELAHTGADLTLLALALGLLAAGAGVKVANRRGEH